MFLLPWLSAFLNTKNMLGIAVFVNYTAESVVYFGRQGTVFQVFPEGPFAILYHYGLELPNELPKSSTFKEEDELSYRYDISLPMHTVRIIMILPLT